jgi:hypothetical protein
MKTLPVCFLTTVLCLGCTDSSNTPPAPPTGQDKPSGANEGNHKEILAALQQLGTAFHDFENTHRVLPAAAVLGKDGKPLLSWRVAILPNIKEAGLYRQFRLDEPWDSEHNQKLLPRMPKVYAPLRGPPPKVPHSTYYQVFTGSDAPFSLTSRFGPRITDFTDGTAQTFLIVEASEAVPWTKPADLVYDVNKPLPKLGFGDRAYLALADGSSHFIKKTVSEPIFRAAITPNGNEREVLFSDDRDVLDEGRP